MWVIMVRFPLSILILKLIPVKPFSGVVIGRMVNGMKLTFRLLTASPTIWKPVFVSSIRLLMRSRNSQLKILSFRGVSGPGRFLLKTILFIRGRLKTLVRFVLIWRLMKVKKLRCLSLLRLHHLNLSSRVKVTWVKFLLVVKPVVLKTVKSVFIPLIIIVIMLFVIKKLEFRVRFILWGPW